MISALGQRLYLPCLQQLHSTQTISHLMSSAEPFVGLSMKTCVIFLFEESDEGVPMWIHHLNK